MSTGIFEFAIVMLFIVYLVYPRSVIFSAFRSKNNYESDDYSYIISNEKFRKQLREEYEKYFLGKFSYYDKLTENLKLKFLFRVKHFIRYKSFEGRENLRVNEEMKSLIAAAAIQLTFGLEEFILEYFSLIIIYPDSYYSSITGLKHMGEANPKGIIVLSWKDFIRGYEIPDDTYNVGLHEMAHALELEIILGEVSYPKFTEHLKNWIQITKDEYENLQDDGNSFFRKYAGTNRREFFAVCIEHFFEESEDFKDSLPEIYDQLCILLNQDPLSRDVLLNQNKN